MADLRQVFIENLRHYRKQSNLRQLDLALEIGKSTNYINSVENGKYFPSPETIDKIAAVLKIDPQKLFDSSIMKKSNAKSVPPTIEKDALAKEIFEKIKTQINDLIETAIAER